MIDDRAAHVAELKRISQLRELRPDEIECLKDMKASITADID